MNFLKKTTLALVSTVFMSTASFAEISQEKALKLLEISGNITIINEMPHTIVISTVEDAKLKNKTISKEVQESLLEKSKASLNPEKLTKDVTTQLAKILSEEDYTSINKWYESKLGKKVVAKDTYYYSRKGHAELTLNQQDKLDKKAQIFSNDVYDATMTNKALLHMIDAMVDGALLGMMQQEDKEMSAEEVTMVRKFLSQTMMAQELPKMKQNIIKDIAFTFKKLSEKEKKSYVQTLKTKSFQKFYQAMTDGSEEQMKQFSSELMEFMLSKPELMQ